MSRNWAGIAAFSVLAACGGGRAAAPPSDRPAMDPEPVAEHDEHGEHGARGKHGPLGHRFERADDWAGHFDSAERDAWQRPEQVVAAMAIEPGMTVADIGAGTGYFVPHLSKAVGA